MTWDEASKIQDANATHTGDHVVLMGAASKGIIQRKHQHNATVYKAPYARNPFDTVTDDEINEYKRTVERKARGECELRFLLITYTSIRVFYIYYYYADDTDYSESEALSGAQIISPSEDESRTGLFVIQISLRV